MNENVRVLIVRASGDTEVRAMNLASDFNGLRNLQETVGGPIEVIVGDGWCGYCNEEGKLERLPVNDVATLLAGRHGWIGAGFDVLVGDVIFTGSVATTEDADIYDDVPEWLIDEAQMLSSY